MKKIFFLFMISVFLFFQTKIFAQAQEHPMKILVLIICSDNFPGSPLFFPYKMMQNVWRSYMHLDPECVEAYFIRGNPNLSLTCKIDGDVIWSKTEESVIPGILNKTISSLEYLLPRLREFDFIVRTNLSSFYVFPNLLDFLKTQPKEKFYCGPNIGSVFASGSGFYMSPDVAEFLVQSKDALINGQENDDVMIGRFLISHGYKLLSAPWKIIQFIEDWNQYKTSNSPRIDFHFRIKGIHELRSVIDYQIYCELLKMYYNIDFEKESSSLPFNK